MSSLDPPKLLQSLLPSPRARPVLWLVVLLAVGLPPLFLWLEIEKLLSLEIAQKLAILTPTLVLVVVGSLVALYLNNEYFKQLEKSLKAPPTNPPDTSKKTRIQVQILKTLASKEADMPSDIAVKLNTDEGKILHNLNVLRDGQLVDITKVGSIHWYITKHGLAQLYTTP